MILPLSLLTACGEPADTDTGQADTTAPYLADPTGEDAPSFSSEDVAGAVQEALSLIMQVDGAPVIAAYESLLSQTDSGCPLWTDYKGTPLWYDTCTTDAGVRFEGYGLALAWDGTDDGSGNIWTGTQLYSAGTITDADGHTFTAGGSAGSLTGYSAEGAQLHYTYVEDGFGWDGPEAAGTWLTWGLSPTLVWYTVRDPGSGGKAIILSGSVGMESGPISAVVLDGLYLVEESLGSSCGIEPSGTISLLDAEGHWYDLIFDGPTDAQPEVPAEVCDGCATAWYRGSALGEACVDFSVLTDW
jgi:hypothetical protein